ncbi:STAS-like domain-containing protein [Croceibacterium mercuriale]|uniref:STAS-like domain-containing protein n=1 Tax=Croceibacterium mercuriale TaxID=1572751 RepID=UPI0009DD369D
MTETVNINIGRQFSRFPSGRTPIDSAFSGEAFREKFLLAPLKAGKVVQVELDDAISYGSSFLDEAFGGLVRKHAMSVPFLKESLKFVSFDRSLKSEIWSYIQNT